MEKFITRTITIGAVLCSVCFLTYKFYDVTTIEDISTKNVKQNNNMLSIMLETDANSGKYEVSVANVWPADGYVFNSELSKCENGSTLNWDDTNKQIIFNGNISDKCYIYFDKNFTLAEYITSQYTGIQGVNNLYLHDSTLENGARDNSLRYAGSSETTNNFVCFGSDEIICPIDNLYRIIGIFDNQIKLIKYDYATTDLLGNDGDYKGLYSSSSYKGSLTSVPNYYWNDNSHNTLWSSSGLNTTNLNTNYLNNIGKEWSNKIITHIWKIGGNTIANIRNSIPSIAYTNEIISPATDVTPGTDVTYEAKIGLMYVSDYGFAAAPSAWKTTLDSYNASSIISVNWMFMGDSEWTITPCSHLNALCISSSGEVGSDAVYFDGYAAVRPVFYLNSTVTYKSGIGTISSPFLLS